MKTSAKPHKSRLTAARPKRIDELQSHEFLQAFTVAAMRICVLVISSQEAKGADMTSLIEASKHLASVETGKKVAFNKLSRSQSYILRTVAQDSDLFVSDRLSINGELQRTLWPSEKLYKEFITTRRIDPSYSYKKSVVDRFLFGYKELLELALAD